jgi:uncharacterized protein (DUF2336 family)
MGREALMFEPAAQPHGENASAARRSHDPTMNGISPDEAMNGTARQRRVVTASSFRELQARLRALSAKRGHGGSAQGHAIPDLAIEPTAAPPKATEIAPPSQPEPEPAEAAADIPAEEPVRASVPAALEAESEPAAPEVEQEPPPARPDPPVAEREVLVAEAHAQETETDAPVAGPDVAEPVVAEAELAVPAQPVAVEPVAAEPVAAEPVVAEPAVAEPAVTEPVAAGVAEAEEIPTSVEAVAPDPEAAAQGESPALPIDEEPRLREPISESPEQPELPFAEPAEPAASAAYFAERAPAELPSLPEPLAETAEMAAAIAAEFPPEPPPAGLPSSHEPPAEPAEMAAVELPLLSDAPPPAADDDLLVPLAQKFAGTSALLKKVEHDSDPFAETSSGLADDDRSDEGPYEIPDPQSGEVARSLLDVMSAPPGSSQPQERALAADTLLRLVPRLPLKNLIGLVERVSLMEAPPQLLIRRLIRDARTEIAGPLLERGSAISDQDLMAVIAENDPAKQRLIARRRTISPALAEALIAAGDAGVLLTLVRNPGATFSIESFHRLGELAAAMPALQAPLATRLDTPAPVAFELFWALPAELRRYILSRFLTDSETLDRVLKIARSVRSGEAAEAAAEHKFPDKEKVDEFVALATGDDRTAAAGCLAELAGISQANADRIIADREGEPITVALKALGLSRAGFVEVIEGIRQSPQALLRRDRNISELQSIFDSLSFNKARMLLTYWDWASQHSGPYARSAN